VDVAGAFGLGLAVWLALATLSEWADRIKFTRDGAMARMTALPRAAHGMMIAHLGMAVLIAGVSGSSAWKQERIQTMAPEETVEIAGYTMTFKGVEMVPGPNYTAGRATIIASKGGRDIATMNPELRLYQQPQTQTTFTSIHTTFFADLYVAVGEAQGAEGAFVTRFYYEPLVPFLWYGVILMALGGFVSLTDRRHRVGAPKRAAAAMGAAVPAAAE
jgi:cytochrome c-type biogenesis protein CcmF